MENVYFDGSNIVASDLSTLFVKPCKKDFNLLLPIAAQKWIVKQNEVTIFETNEGYILGAFGSKFEFTKVEGRYPDYKKVMPVNELVLKVNKKELVKSLAQVRKLANQACNLVCLRACDNLFEVSTKDVDFNLDAKVNVLCENLQGIYGNIGFNSEKLLTVLSLIASDIVEIKLKNEFSGCYFNDILLMPMNLENCAGISQKVIETETKHASENSDTDEKICKSIALQFAEPDLLETNTGQKINRSNLMKNAWTLYRFYNGDYSWSEVLKMVWYDARKMKLAA
jgi:hypothetical protein